MIGFVRVCLATPREGSEVGASDHECRSGTAVESGSSCFRPQELQRHCTRLVFRCHRHLSNFHHLRRQIHHRLAFSLSSREIHRHGNEGAVNAPRKSASFTDAGLVCKRNLSKVR